VSLPKPGRAWFRMPPAGGGKERNQPKPAAKNALKHQSRLPVFGLPLAPKQPTLSGPILGGGDAPKDREGNHILRMLAYVYNSPPKAPPADGTAATSPAPNAGVRSRLLAAAKRFRRPWGLSRGGSASRRLVRSMACLRRMCPLREGRVPAVPNCRHFSRRNIRADGCRRLRLPRLEGPRRHAGEVHRARPAWR
jgi:hypothetical protein